MICEAASSGPIEINLSQTDWQFKEQGGPDNWLPAAVPGTVHTDLFNAGKIPDLYYRNNEKELQWIGEKDWEYRTHFTVSKEVLEKDIVEMVFNGLDTYATIFINDYQVLSTENFHRTYKLDCKQWLNEGNNTLRIIFKSAAKVVEELKKSSYLAQDDRYVYIRKPAYHFGWDWGPIYLTCGIWRPIILKAWDKVQIENIQFKQLSLTKEKAELMNVIEVRSCAYQRATISLTCVETNQTQEISQRLQYGKNYIQIPLTINNPKWWWTKGLGEQNLYHFRIEAKIDGKTVSTLNDYTGLRTVRIIQEKDASGESFLVELNGERIFIKGSDYIPQDMFIPRATQEDYEGVIKQATDVNMNMLRIWGGGFFENDLFYELCDQNGLLVWQDFMFACAMYPGDEAFINNVRQETIDNIKRLRNHPCIALWCGNNENLIGWNDWNWQKPYSKETAAQVWFDYEKLFHQMLPEVVNQYDEQRFYWPSSPLFGWGYDVSTAGDSHNWGVWHAQDPFEKLADPTQIPRFMSEFGFQSCPDMNSVKRFTLPEDWSITSDVMKTHQKHHIGYPVIDKYMNWYYNPPKDFESYLYISQVMQGWGMEFGIDVHRRSRPHCMGTLYWQINDCYPVCSWASVDYYDSWKAMHYKVRELYKDLVVSFAKDSVNNRIDVFIISDKLKEENGNLRIYTQDFKGNKLFFTEKQLPLKPNQVEKIASYDIADLLKDKPANQVVMTAELRVGDSLVSCRNYYFVLPKDLDLVKKEVKTKVQKTEDGYQVTLSTKTLVKDLYVSFPDYPGNFDDNYFDLLPGSVKVITFKTGQTIPQAGKRLRLFSLEDSYN